MPPSGVTNIMAVYILNMEEMHYFLSISPIIDWNNWEYFGDFFQISILLYPLP